MAKLKDELADMRDSIDEQRKEIQRVMEEHELGDDGAFGALHNVKVGLDIVVMHQMPRYLDFLDFLEQDTVLQIQRLTKERDYARWTVCRLLAAMSKCEEVQGKSGRTAKSFAKRLGWDCFKQSEGVQKLTPEADSADTP